MPKYKSCLTCDKSDFIITNIIDGYHPPWDYIYAVESTGCKWHPFPYGKRCLGYTKISKDKKKMKDYMQMSVDEDNARPDYLREADFYAKLGDDVPGYK